MYKCTECDYTARKWLGKCPSCNSFNTLEEWASEEDTSRRAKKKKALPAGTTVTIKKVDSKAEERLPTNIPELDRVLSGGIVAGSLILVGGEPGIGKSTLLLQLCGTISQAPVLYISGEESTSQIVLRAKRLGITTDDLLIMADTNLDIIEATVAKITPRLLIIDSIQTMFAPDISSTPGSVATVRECCHRFMEISKKNNIATIIVGHVTKEGSLAGPKMLEHMVDTVLYFEGEKNLSYRIIRATKNRFGNTNEIGIFKMEQEGLVEIQNPSEYMLSGRPLGVSGSVITCTAEGTRPILAEVQALVSPTGFGIPRRTATGCDYNRVMLLMAVLEKKLNFNLSTYDAYINIAGGMKIAEPALDAALVVAIASSYKNVVVEPSTIVLGEVGLAGEMRAVNLIEKRVAEASKLGFRRCILPRANGYETSADIEIIMVSNVAELLSAVK